MEYFLTKRSPPSVLIGQIESTIAAKVHSLINKHII
jgi:hypothetical protein